jgi:hypothetical protein
MTRLLDMSWTGGVLLFLQCNTCMLGGWLKIKLVKVGRWRDATGTKVGAPQNG